MLSTYSMEDMEVLSTASGQWLAFLTFSSTGTFQGNSNIRAKAVAPYELRSA